MPRRPLLAAFLLPLLLLMLPGAALADPRDDLFAAWQRFLALTSFRSQIHSEGPPATDIALEFQAPDRYRMVMANGPTNVLVGGTAYMTIGGRTMKLPVPAQSMAAQYRDEAFLAKLKEGMVVEDLGKDSLDGQPVRKLRYVQEATPPGPPGAAPAGKGQATTVAWVAIGSGRILKLEVDSEFNGKRQRTVIRYSDFDDPSITIQAPK